MYFCFFSIRYEPCYFALTFQHLADTFNTVERQHKEEYKLNSKAVQFSPSIFSKCTQTQLQEKNRESGNAVLRQKNIEIQTCLFCQLEIKDAVTDIVEELVLNVEHQFLDDAFDREKCIQQCQ